MNQKNLVFGVVSMLFAAIFIFSGCQPIVENGNEPGREGTFDKDSLLIEVWDSSTPPKFLGYDTGMRYYDGGPVILTSKGYCVELSFLNYYGQKSHYGPRSYLNNNLSWEEQDTYKDVGIMLFFKTASNPTINDTPYLGSRTTLPYLVNYVVYNPHDGGTYYTWAGISEIGNFPPNFKLIDADGMLRTCNDDIVGALFVWLNSPSDLVGEQEYPEYLIPLKKVGGYSELGLPNPDDIRTPLVYKVQ